MRWGAKNVSSIFSLFGAHSINHDRWFSLLFGLCPCSPHPGSWAHLYNSGNGPTTSPHTFALTSSASGGACAPKCLLSFRIILLYTDQGGGGRWPALRVAAQGLWWSVASEGIKWFLVLTGKTRQASPLTFHLTKRKNSLPCITVQKAFFFFRGDVCDVVCALVPFARAECPGVRQEEVVEHRACRFS